MAKGVITPPETQAEARRLYNAGLTAREIEELTGTPKDTVISWLKPAMKRRKEHRSAEGSARGLVVTEISEAGSVGTLFVSNPLDLNVLLYEGQSLFCRPVRAREDR